MNSAQAPTTRNAVTERLDHITNLVELINDRLEERDPDAYADVRAREWWTEKDACARKNVPYNELRLVQNRLYLPNHGKAARMLENGRWRKMYHWTWVREWLPLDKAAIDKVLYRGDWLNRVDQDGRVLVALEQPYGHT